MIREALESVARNESIGDALSRTPLVRDVVKRLVAGESVDDALAVSAQLVESGRYVCLERAAPPAPTAEAADHLVDEYLALITLLSDAGLAQDCELALLATALGLDGEGSSTPIRLSRISTAARNANIAVMLGAAAPDDVPISLRWADALRAEGVGVTIPALLRSAESDCRLLADTRVRLVKGGHPGRAGGTYQQPVEIDKSFVRCAKSLLRGSGDASFATHDPRLVAIVEDLALRYGRPRDSFEFAFYMGRSQATQDRLADNGYRVRVYVPYGPDWFERLVGGLAEQPSSIAAALRSLLPGGTSQEGR